MTMAGKDRPVVRIPQRPSEDQPSALPSAPNSAEAVMLKQVHAERALCAALVDHRRWNKIRLPPHCGGSVVDALYPAKCLLLTLELAQAIHLRHPASDIHAVELHRLRCIEIIAAPVDETDTRQAGSVTLTSSKLNYSCQHL